MTGLGVISAILLLISPVTSYDYCHITCNGARHTMCVYPAGGSSKCGDFIRGISTEEQQLILYLHNEMRRKVATGRERKGPQPPASDMLQLGWDREAETIAQRWAEQCDQQGHDSCRKSKVGQEVGQNIAWISQYSTGAKITREEAIRTMMAGLYDEVAKFNGPVVRYQSDPKTGHYTQIVWSSTSAVGCGLVERRSGHRSEFKLVCNYSPAGNWIGEAIYKIGTACSECPEGTWCSPVWQGLCSY